MYLLKTIKREQKKAAAGLMPYVMNYLNQLQRGTLCF